MFCLLYQDAFYISPEITDKYLDIADYNYCSLWHCAAYTSVNCRTFRCPGHDVKLHPRRVKL